MSAPKKYMSFWMMVALVTGNMVGSGIFLLPSGLAAFGSISLLSWVFTATGAILLALVFCNMSRLVPNQDGGPYIYVREGLGKFMGFQSGFGYWVAAWVGNAAIVLAMVGYLQFFFPILANKTATGWTAILIIWALAFLNMFGARKMGWVQLVST
ncbi:amino acid permease, partial [Francisellaceae bacterium]|nr:amino acid permease [Francisellaceae bacterium]